jgi:hypothetical protein
MYIALEVDELASLAARQFTPNPIGREVCLSNAA